MKLNLFFDGVRVGAIEGQSSSMVLTYDERFLDTPGRFPLSGTLPLSRDPLPEAAVSSFLENMLPEGTVRDRVFQNLRLNTGDIMGYLSRRGMDLPGGLVVTEEQQPPTVGAVEPIDRVELHRRIEAAQNANQPVITGEKSRLSLAGVQEKTAIRVNAAGDLALTSGAELSTHILKPDALLYPDLAVNEYFVMQLARACGIDVPTVIFDAVLDAFIIERYDRYRDEAGRVRPIYQIDFCQAVGLPSVQKYDTKGTHIALMATVIGTTKAPLLARTNLFRRIVFDVLVGNRDNHLKNFSLVGRDGAFELSPAYDLVCTDAFPGLDREQALVIGGLVSAEQIHLQAMTQAGIDLGLKEVPTRRHVVDMKTRLLEVMPSVAEQCIDELGARGKPMIERITGIIRRNIGLFDELSEVQEKLSN